MTRKRSTNAAQGFVSGLNMSSGIRHGDGQKICSHDWPGSGASTDRAEESDVQLPTVCAIDVVQSRAHGIRKGASPDDDAKKDRA
ncbi:MAG: hypothetical protein NPIRA02_27530 [Nitrospirales bacterium]|nr:MAG: hypothetical protein NPIRA02_27530 [Nitrospirales bacterium]